MHAPPSPATDRPSSGETALLTVDLAALTDNWRLLAKRGAPAECAAVIKANAYGLGLEPVMRALLGAGCRTFFVATAREGERARAVSSEAVVYVLDGLAPGAMQRLMWAKLRPVLNSLAEIDEWSDAGAAALHFDTGMNRMGLPPADAGAAAERFSAQGAAPTLVMSHFVSAQWRDDPRNIAQIDAFAAIRARFPGVSASLCNSSGVFLGEKAHLDVTRPGYAIYGGNPTPGEPNPMRGVARLEARVLATREIPAGASVGYDATWSAARPTRLATLALGYADGLPIGASSGPGGPATQALVRGTRCPIVGRVSMDFLVLDVTDAPAVGRGDWIEILGDDITVDELAARSGTIGYEILTRLGGRYARRHVGGENYQSEP